MVIPLELVAPAGNADIGIAAIDHGADTVYIGAPKFSARAEAGNSFEEIERLKTEPPSRKELEDNRSYLLGSYVRHRETPQDVARDLWLIESQGLSADYLDRFLEGIARAEKGDCERFLEETLEPSKMSIVVVGDASKLKDELAEIAPVTVIHEQKEEL